MLKGRNQALVNTAILAFGSAVVCLARAAGDLPPVLRCASVLTDCGMNGRGLRRRHA